MKMDDGQIAAVVESRAKWATGGWDSRLSGERSNVQRYYDGHEPKPMSRGDSKYVSMDVYDGVESMKAQLLETFSGNAQPVQFAPQGPEDAQHAADATEYANYAVFRQNPGFAILNDVIDDALKGRVGIVKVYWDENEEEVEEEVKDVPFADLEAILMAKPEADVVELELDEDEGKVERAVLVTERDCSQVRIEPVAPEEFGITKNAKSASDADIVFHRAPRTADQLLRMDIPKKLVEQLKADEAQWSQLSAETLERHRDTDDGYSDPVEQGEDSKARQIIVTEAYLRLDLDGRPKLWMVLVAGGKVLKKKPVRRLPFLFFTPLPRPHAFWGNNYARMLIQIQNARTLLTRSIINHALITNNPRTGVVKGGLVDPKELMENRLGGLVNLTRPDALVPITQTGLNPFVFQTIQQLDTDKEQNTGISRLSTGLNKDAISKQNSAEMVQNLVGLSQVRQKVVARHFAERFLKELFLEVYRLIVENETAERIIEVAGEWKPVDPTSWPDRKDVVAEVNVGYGEKDAEREKWVQVDQYLSQDPRFGNYYTPDRRYNVVKRALAAMGIKDTNSVLADPKSVPPPEPDPMQQAELAHKQAQAESAKAQAQATMAKIQQQAEKDAAQHQLDMAELQAKVREMQARLALDAEALDQKERMQEREMALAERTAAQAETATASANIAPDA